MKQHDNRSALGAESAKRDPPACERAAAEKRMTNLGEAASGGPGEGGGGGGSWLGGAEFAFRTMVEGLSRLDEEDVDPQPALVASVCVIVFVSLALMLYAFQITVSRLERGLIAAEHHGSWTPVAPTESDISRVASIEQLRLQRRIEREQWQRTSGVVQYAVSQRP